MALTWGWVADFTQRGIALTMFALTLYGSVILARGGYGVVQRRRQRKALTEQEDERGGGGGDGGGKLIAAAAPAELSSEEAPAYSSQER